MLCMSINRRRPFSYHMKMADFEFFVFCTFSLEKKKEKKRKKERKKALKEAQKIALNMASSDSQTDKPQRVSPKRVELPDVNINTGAQSINNERTSF